jgi:FMN phosphatase YigB (HAD superfamily)
MIKAILFDLDGTLLPMDQDQFVASYLKRLVKKLAPYGYDPKKLIDTIYDGITAMYHNDGTQSNENAFWNVFTSRFGADSRKDEPIFMDFYNNEFHEAREACGFAPESTELIRFIREKGLRVALATNPLFPAVATHNRIRWAGLRPEDFELVTTFENSCFCKPNPAYYQEILGKLNLAPEECAMVGNDVAEDMVVRKMGMEVFLLTDCLINKDREDIDSYPHGSYPELITWIRGL